MASNMETIELPAYYNMMQHLYVSDGYVSGLVNKESLELIIDLHCKDTCHHYVCSHLTDFEKRHLKHPGEIPRVMWQYKTIPFTGIPFRVKSYREHRCQFGMSYLYDKKRPDKNGSSVQGSEKGTELQIVEEEHSYKRKRKKVDSRANKPVCFGKIKYRELIRYPQFKIDGDISKRTVKFNIMDRLKAALLRGDELETDTVFSLSIPLDSAHNHSGSPSLHPLVANKIKSLVYLGFSDLSEIKKSLRKYVNVELKKNLKIDTSDAELFYPGMREIRRAVRRAIDTERPVAIPEFNQQTNIDSILVELPDNESLSKLLSSSGIQIYTVPEGDDISESLQNEFEADGSKIELAQVAGEECSIAIDTSIGQTVNIATSEATEEIHTLETAAVIENQTASDAMSVVSIMVDANGASAEICGEDANVFANRIQDKLVKIQQLSPALCDPDKRNSLMKALDAEIETLMSAHSNAGKIVEASLESPVVAGV